MPDIVGRPVKGQNRLGTVLAITPRGVVFSLGSKIKGTMHPSYLSWLNRPGMPEITLKPGAELTVIVKAVHTALLSGELCVRLGHPYTGEKPWERARKTHPKGSRAKGKVVEFYPGGAFLEFQSGFRAWLRNEELSWTRPDCKASQSLKKGDGVEVVVCEHDAKKRRLYVSRRQLCNHPCVAFLGKHPIGSVTTGIVASRWRMGWLVCLSEACAGLLAESEVPSARPIALGETLRVRVLGLHPNRRRINLGWPQQEKFAEGRERLGLHRRKERNAKAVQRKKEHVLATTGSLRCEVCDFDFYDFYGQTGFGVAECHHIVPVSELTAETRIRLSDLAIVCSNCHTMLHHPPMPTIPQLRALVATRRRLNRDRG
ncbi:MAG TPA: S1 RNA-binding domain-containing protein [Gemmataceae bacterium]